MGEWEFFDNPESLDALIAQTVGVASMCWSETPTGIFDSERAVRLTKEFKQYLIVFMDVRKEQNA